LFVDDFILRQIEQLANLVASLASASTEELSEEAVDEQFDEAYEKLIGMSADMLAATDASEVRRLLHDEAQLDALVRLSVTHADACVYRDNPDAAARHVARALSYLSDDDPRVPDLLERFASMSSPTRT